MRFAGLMLLAPAFRCAHTQAAASSSPVDMSNFIPQDTVGLAGYATFLKSFGLEEIRERLHEWCIIENDLSRPPATKVEIVEVKLSHDERFDLDAGCRIWDIQVILLTDKNVIDTIRKLAGNLKYGYLEVLHHIFQNINLSYLESCFRNGWYATMEEGRENIVNNCADAQLGRIRACIEEEIAAALGVATSEYLNLNGTPTSCSYHDVLAHLLRRNKMLETDFYKDLAGVFTALLEDKAQRGRKSDILEPLFHAVLELTRIGSKHAIHCRETLLGCMMAVNDSAVADMLTWPKLRSGKPVSDLIAFMASKVGENISPYFLSGAINWYSLHKQNRCDSTFSDVMDLLINYFFGQLKDDLSSKRLNILFADKALLRSFPEAFHRKLEGVLLHDMRAGVANGERDYKTFMNLMKTDGNNTS
ncbi:hypothetical protein PAPHI01_1399 [Pancytospora philotis]|nr:hypothetical protein PAPHI01_1399 [Pancytospora philotis]